MIKSSYTVINWCLVILVVNALSSCGGFKNYKYFQDIPDSLSNKTIPTAIYNEPRIQTDDILYIAIQTIDPSAGSSINTLNGPTISAGLVNNAPNAAGTSASQSATYGYLVDKQGNVTIPIIGDVQLNNLTTQEAKLLLTKSALKFYKEPSVIVRFANFKVSILGEVQKPGTYTIPNERISVLDAIGYAGDLTIYGKRDNVLLLRRDESSNNTTAIRLNLNKSDVFNSPYFYLKQNDQIYIEPNKAKVTNSDGTQLRTISIVSAVLSLLIVIASRF
jgi:polysaccharide export outer membrane protein